MGGRVYCVAPNCQNTINLVTYGEERLNGVRVDEFAKLADRVYDIDPNDRPQYGHRHPSWTAPQGWTLEHVFYSPSAGFMAALYCRGVDFALVFRGSDLGELIDWEVDAAQALGLSTSQYGWAIAVTRDVLDGHIGYGDKSSMTFVGHSLGGGLAACAQWFAPAVPMVTYNAAGIHNATRDRAIAARGAPYPYANLVRDATPLGRALAYHVYGDPVTVAQEASGGSFPTAEGERVTLRVGHEYGWTWGVRAHMMGAVLSGLRQIRRDE